MNNLAWMVGVSALVLTGQALADDAVPPECKLRENNPKLIANIKESPNYFSKVTPDGKYQCYIADDTNIIIDLEHPDTKVIVPGPFDPVPAPPVGPEHKTRHLSAPSGSGYNGMAFYKMADIESAMKPGQTNNVSQNLQPVHLDQNNQNNYQSIGVLPGTQNHPVYRMLSGSLSIDDYDTTTTPWKVVRHYDTVCGEEGRYQLPMLSKDGQELSVYDTSTQTTKILGVHNDGTCEEKLNLGYPTGKVEFSYDGKAIAFHVDSFASEDLGHEFSGVSNKVTKNVYMLNLVRNGNKLKAGAIRRLTSNTVPGQGSYYPSFTASGDVVFVQGTKDDSGRTTYGFVKVDPKPVPAMNFDVNDSACVDRTAAQFALGSLWTQVCSKYAGTMSATDAALWTLSLDPKACVQLVRENWNRMKDSVLSDDRIGRSGVVTPDALHGITAASLEKVCPTDRNSSPRGRTVAVAALNAVNVTHGPQSGHDVYASRCLSCHNGTQARTFDYNHLKLDEINNMLIEIDSGDMPREHVENRETALKPLVDDLLRKRTQAEQESVK